MPFIALVGSEVLGMTAGEHSGHVPPHPPCELTGTVTKGTHKIQDNGIHAGIALSPVAEVDCCDPGTGKLASHSHKLRVNGVPIQVITDSTLPHNGTAKVITGSSKIRTV